MESREMKKKQKREEQIQNLLFGLPKKIWRKIKFNENYFEIYIFSNSLYFV